MNIDLFNVLNVVLGLLLIFQWYKQRAKEQSVKHNLIAIRRAVERIQGLTNLEVITQKSKDLADSLDATLATIGARKPFEKKRNEILRQITQIFRSEEEKPLEKLPNESDD